MLETSKSYTHTMKRKEKGKKLRASADLPSRFVCVRSTMLTRLLLLVQLLFSNSEAYVVTTTRPSTPVRCVTMMAASTDDAAVTKASAVLLAEISKDSRSLTSIEQMVKGLEQTKGKVKKGVQGDWKIVYATDEAAVKQFTADR